MNPLDEDMGQQYTYELVDDDDGTFEVKGDKLICKKDLDYETMKDKEFKITMKVTDDGTPPLSVSHIFLPFLCWSKILKDVLNFQFGNFAVYYLFDDYLLPLKLILMNHSTTTLYW